MTVVAGGGAVACERCGAANTHDARFCSSCGNRLGDQATEERKLVSVLFVDLEGFTATSDRADPEDVRDLLTGYHSDAKACIEQYGGTLEKFIGDAVMAVFGVPISHGDDAERAVRAGLRVLEKVGESGLSARAAVNTGEAVVRVSESASGEAIALGDVVNTASRLQSHAPAGRVLVGEATFRATRHAVRYEPHGAVSAKGKAEPLDAWLAVEPLPDATESFAPAGPFVGRQRELGLIESVWQQAVSEAKPQLVTLLGSPGVGKSRLCREVTDVVRRDGGLVIRGRCLPYEEQTGYQAFSQIVRQRAGIFDSDAPTVAAPKLDATVRELFPADEVTDRLMDFSLLLGLESGRTVIDQRLLFFSARRLVEAVGAEQPVLIVFEDVHWGAPSELDLVEYLGAHVRDTRAVIVALARPEFLDARPAWGGAAAQTRIPLDPLASALAHEMVATLLPDAADDEVARIVEVAEGNPLFIEELAAAVSDCASDELPVTVVAAIAARIDALPAATRATLLAAAVVGRTFWHDVLDAIVEVEDVASALEDLDRRDLIRREARSRLEGDVEYRFKHALIREVAYGTLPRAARRERHAATARFVEERTGGAESVAWVLAHHWREAGEPGRAIPYLLAAAEIAERTWATEEARNLYATAIELAETPLEQARLRIRRGFALNVFGKNEAALEDLEPILDQLEGADLLDAFLYTAKAYVWTEQDGKALETAERALELAGQLGDVDAAIAATALVAEGLAMRGEPGDIDRSLELGDDALHRWRRGVRSFELADHSHMHADVKYWVGDYERTLELGSAAYELGDDVHSIEVVLRGGGLRAMALTGLGRHEEALAAINATIAVEQELGGDGAYLRNYTSMIHRELADLPAAREMSELALERALTQSFSMPRRFAQSDLLLTSLLERDFERAQADWPALWTDSVDATAWTRWLIRGRLAASKAQIALHLDSPEDAAEWARTAIELAVSARRRKYEAIARSTLGEALSSLGDRDGSRAEHAAAIRIADDLVGAPARYDARAAFARSAYAVGLDDVAAATTAEAQKLVDEFAATLAPERAELVRASAVVQELFASS